MGAMTGEARVQGRGGLATPGGDVARAPSPLQGVEEQGRGGLATSGGLTTPDVARAPSPLRGNFIFDTIHTP